jgi:hypothetical protein
MKSLVALRPSSPIILFQAIQMTAAKLKTELAIALFEREWLALGQAAMLAGMPHSTGSALSSAAPSHSTVEISDAAGPSAGEEAAQRLIVVSDT